MKSVKNVVEGRGEEGREGEEGEEREGEATMFPYCTATSGFTFTLTVGSFL